MRRIALSDLYLQLKCSLYNVAEGTIPCLIKHNASHTMADDKVNNNILIKK